MFEINEIEDKVFAPYAVKSKDTRGRVYPEKEHPYRSPFQRDRDRVVHSSAFRRLEFKTQVFVPSASDYYRTRLTHTIEVAQIARTCARCLRINEELTEAIALAHDLGHPPFGHIGEQVLHKLMQKYGGFEHNNQSLRVVQELESRYPDFPGLNLTYEVREGITKHKTMYDLTELELPADDMPPLEAQTVNRADEITYTCHDTDDGLKSGILSEKDLRSLTISGNILAIMDDHLPAENPKMRRYHLIRLLINTQVTDLLEETIKNLKKLNIRTVDDIRNADDEIVRFSPEMEKQTKELRMFLYKNFYHHPRIRKMADYAKKHITSLFKFYLKHPETITPDLRDRSSAVSLERVVCDYIAGMTDRFAILQYKRLIKK
ncbi:MAG: deoxyguanosinetriphosphate triphosphohydrolase [bacterium]